MLCNQNDHIKEIKLNEKEYRITLGADDTEIPLNGTDQSLAATTDTLKYFETVSGLKLILRKLD